MTPELRKRLRRNLDAATDEALVALANKGLMRRALKDVEAAAAFLIEEAAESLVVRGDGWVVTMPPEGPVAATDDSTATGVTRFILAAAIYLRENWFPEVMAAASDASMAADTSHSSTDAGTESDVGREALQRNRELIFRASAADLAKWAGRTPLLEAFAVEVAAEVAWEPNLKVEFPEQKISVLLLTDRPAKTIRRLLDQFRTTAPRQSHACWILRAIIAIRRQAGQPIDVPDHHETDISDAVKADRSAVVGRTRNLLKAMVLLGIAHPSSSMVQRLQTMAVSADAARFPRMARLLNSLADDVGLHLQRHASADRARVVERMASASALVAAVQRAEMNSDVQLPSGFFGRYRSVYSPAGDLELAGVAAYHWSTASGFEGLTTVFWDQSRQRFLTASAARGGEQDPFFDAMDAYRKTIGWKGGSSLEQMCRSRFRLRSARVSDAGRLSLSESSSVEDLQPLNHSEIDFGVCRVERFVDVREAALRALPLGLHLPHPLENLVCLRPTEWGRKWFDELNQRLVWEVYGPDQQRLELILPWDDVHERAIDFVEAVEVKRDQLTSVLGFAELVDGQIRLRPVSFFSTGGIKGDTIFCPQFDQAKITSRQISLIERLRQKFRKHKHVPTSIGPTEDVSDAQMAVSLSSAPAVFQTLLFRVDEFITAWMESGVGQLDAERRERMMQLSESAESMGLSSLTAALREIDTEADHVSAQVINAAYHVMLARQSASLAVVD